MHDLTPDPGCAPVSDLLPDLVHGRLAGDARARAERHVAACAGCAAELAMLRGARAALRTDTPGVDLAAVAAAVRAATIPPAAARVPAGHLRAVAARPAPPRAVARPSRWRVGQRGRVVAATLLAAVGAGAAWFGRPVAGDRPAAGTPAPVVAVAPAPAAPPAAPRGSAARGTPAAAPTPAVLASAEPALGARFDDLSDEELQAVIAAVEGASGLLPAEEPTAELTELGVGG